MMRAILPILQIDTEFQKLIPPLTNEEFAQLENNILNEGCRDPICMWRGFIIDGHNRYKICHKHGIEFKIVELHLTSREDVMSWICTNQLGRRNISEETRRYLIGKKYEAEKAVGIMNSLGTNQHTIESDIERKPHTSKTARRIGREFHVSHSTVNKYAKYSRAIDKLNEDMPEVAEGIKDGKIKISQDNLLQLVKKPKEEITQIVDNIYKRQQDPRNPNKSENVHIFTSDLPQKTTGTVKDMPKFDPDSYVSSLSLTIPSWVSSIKRAYDNSDMEHVSISAKKVLVTELENLIGISKYIKNKLEE